ncbi:hypothetical protein V1514DRAFT_336824 [Lipomyces japonicus]|uniref:uncharacterized protein n=1 Tax=Lipomyces japonicus TaxID=56871 RepID=UPI0034CED2E4
MRCDTCLHQNPSISNKSPITPPAESSPASIMNTASTILRSQSMALTHLTELYAKDDFTQKNYISAIQHMHNSQLSGGKIVITGMGKSYKIADKLVATMNSLGIHAATLHPSDALHGDLGVLRPADVLIMISASGNTPELNTLLPHVPAGLPRICLTCNPEAPLAKSSAAVLSAHVPKTLTEKELYGVPAPTTTTTACLAVGDAVCITLAEIITQEQEQRKKNFGRWHPGGAIGNDYQKETKDAKVLYRDIMTPWANIGSVDDDADELEVLRAAAGREWVCIGQSRLYRGHELARQSRNHGIALSSLRKVGQKDQVADLKNGEIVIVMGDFNSIVGLVEN